MANVVGVLVVVMAVTQISVADAMKRILALSSAEASVLDERRAELEARWSALAPDAMADQRELGLFREHLRALEAVPEAAGLHASDTATIEAAVAQRTWLARELEEEVGASRRALASLRLRVRDMPSHRDPDANRVRLPDPRPAPEGSVRMDFFCRYGRVMLVDLDSLEKQLINTARQTVGAEADKVRLQYSDLAKIARHFRRNRVGTEALRWRVFDRGPGALIARLDWRDRSVGETTDEISRSDSTYRRALLQHDPSRHHLRFSVWSGSFDVYLEARRAAEARGFAAGWQPFDEEREFEGNILSGPRVEHPVPVD